MKWGFFGLAVVLTAWATSGAQTFVLHGLTNVMIGNATFGSNSYLKGIVFNLGSDETDGVSIQLGEADSGLFVYPSTDSDPRNGSSMAGKVYGTVNGETNRLICRMRCHEERDGIHPVEIDFSALGATGYTYLAYHRGSLVARSQTQAGHITAYGNYFDRLHPRVNPFWRLADGSVGALIEFLNLEAYGYYSGDPANISVPGIGDVRADRLFVRAEGTTNTVEFASRLDITGGSPLEWFSIYDARLGVFRRAHKAVPSWDPTETDDPAQTLLVAHGGRLTLANTNDIPGVAIELEMPAAFDVAFAPIDFGTNATVVMTAIATGMEQSGVPLGEGRVVRAGDVLQVSAHVAAGVTTVVYHAGAEVGRAAGTNASASAAARLIGAGAQARAAGTPHLRFRFDQSVAVVLPDQRSVEGDEVRFEPDGEVRLPVLETLVINASGLAAFTIVSENEEPVARPRLAIARMGRDVEFSWVDPNRIFQIETSGSVTGPFYALQENPSYEGDVARVSVEHADSEGSRFYRLSTHPQPPPWEK